ncbi:MAG: hypothetical protein HQL66_12170, partial [Magnetococcales bacterium]|nr:hypothetical protein [Magnetococcales bacterium]
APPPRVVTGGRADPVILGRLGYRHLLNHGADDPLTLEPLYLRRADAEKDPPLSPDPACPPCTR